MLTKSQKIMVADGFPKTLLIPQQQRAAWWIANPELGITFTHSFKDPKEDKLREIREQLKQEETALRIRKLLAGQVRKAIAIKPRDIRGKRWDSRNNKWIPIDPQELNMKYDTEKQTDGEQATPSFEPLTVAGNEDNMTQAVKAPKAKKAVKAKAKPAKKVVKAKAKPAKKVVKAKAKPAKKTNGNAKKPANGAYGKKTETVLSLLKKGVTRAELLAKLGWNAINVYQFVPKTKLRLIKTEGERQVTYKLK